MNLFKRKNKDTDQFENFPAIGAVMASKMVTEQKRKVRFLYREKPSNNQDSGWRIFSGFEDQDYTDNPNNTGIYAPATILKIDPSIADLLLNPVGSVFERLDENLSWYEVNDFEFEDDYLAKQKITDNWTIEINNLFVRQEGQEGDIIYGMKGKTVRIAVWNYEDKMRQELYEYHKNLVQARDEKDEPILETFELSDNSISRIGYMIEESDNKKKYKVIYGFSIVDREVIQLALYFDNDNDLDWAVETWKKINFEK